MPSEEGVVAISRASTSVMLYMPRIKIGVSSGFGRLHARSQHHQLRETHDLQAAVIKVPHHGSRTSSSEPFVRAVDPRVAVFSVPRDSRFGHPHPAVVQRYRARGAAVFRTDEQGAVTVRTDGRTLRLAPYVGAPAVLAAPATPRWRRNGTTWGSWRPLEALPPYRGMPSR
jgi:hypothetical protein